MTDRRCDACRFFLPGKSGGAGECRRFPPRMVVGREKRAPGWAHLPSAEFPLVDPGLWCGEFAVAEQVPS